MFIYETKRLINHQLIFHRVLDFTIDLHVNHQKRLIFSFRPTETSFWVFFFGVFCVGQFPSHLHKFFVHSATGVRNPVVFSLTGALSRLIKMAKSPTTSVSGAPQRVHWGRLVKRPQSDLCLLSETSTFSVRLLDFRSVATIKLTHFKLAFWSEIYFFRSDLRLTLGSYLKITSYAMIPMAKRY